MEIKEELVMEDLADIKMQREPDFVDSSTELANQSGRINLSMI